MMKSQRLQLQDGKNQFFFYVSYEEKLNRYFFLFQDMTSVTLKDFQEVDAVKGNGTRKMFHCCKLIYGRQRKEIVYCYVNEKKQFNFRLKI